MSFDLILHNLESGKISAEQAKELVMETLLDIRNGSKYSDPLMTETHKTAVDCVMIRFELVTWEETI